MRDERAATSAAWTGRPMAPQAAGERAAGASEPLVNCIMLTRWPERRAMVQHAIEAFARQDWPCRVLTIVNSGEPCQLSGAFREAGLSGRVVCAPPGTPIGEKRNLGASAVADAQFIASFDDDDYCLPCRLRAQVERLGGDAVWLSASRKFVALHTLGNIVGFEYGRCFGAGMIRAEIARELRWPPIDYCEDQRLYEQVLEHPAYGAVGGGRIVEADDLLYVHRRHESNVSAPHRKDLWAGVLPLQLGGPGAAEGAEAVGAAVAREVEPPWLVDGGRGGGLAAQSDG